MNDKCVACGNEFAVCLVVMYSSQPVIAISVAEPELNRKNDRATHCATTLVSMLLHGDHKLRLVSLRPYAAYHSPSPVLSIHPV
jgi:hypothetical protein